MSEIIISKTKVDDNSFIIQRVINGNLESLKETTEDSGEIPDPDSELITVQTIVITRRIGEKIVF